MSDSEVIPLSDEADGVDKIKPLPNYFSNTETTICKQTVHRIWRTIISIMPLIAVVLSTYEYMAFMQILSLMMLCIFGIPIIRLLYLIYSAPNIHRIHCYSKTIPNWLSLSVTYKIGEFEQESVHSISEFSQISGDKMMPSMLSISENIWFISMVAFVLRITQFENDIHLDDILILIGVFGLLLREIWEFNPCSLAQRIVHYIGDILWSSVIGAYGWQTSFDYAFFIMTGLAITFFVLWIVISCKADKCKGVDPKRISLHSKLMLSCEIFMLCQGAIALILWSWNYNEDHL